MLLLELKVIFLYLNNVKYRRIANAVTLIKGAGQRGGGGVVYIAVTVLWYVYTISGGIHTE